MSGPVFYCDLAQIREAGRRYVAEGVQDPRFMSERQRDVDGALVFLQSDQAAKLRPAGLQHKNEPVREPARTVLEVARRG